MNLLFWRRSDDRPLGVRGEDAAAKALIKAGYTIVDRNVRLGRLELDIIAREGDTVAFVEVKTRKEEGVFRPEDNVGYTKQRHICLAAKMYIANHPADDVYYRYDIVSVILPDGAKPDITIHRNAFEDH